MLVWMHEDGFDTKRQYLIRTTAGYVPGMITELRYRVDVNTLHRSDADSLELNEIGRVRDQLYPPDGPRCLQKQLAATGSFVVVDRLNNLTGCGRHGAHGKCCRRTRRRWHHRRYVADDAGATQSLDGARMAVVWLTGLPKAGKSPVAVALEKLLIENGHAAHVLMDHDYAKICR